RAHPGADVHVARHHHHVLGEERPVAGDRGRHHPHSEAGVVALERDLVAVLERAELDRLHLPLPEVVDDRRLRLLVDDPVVPGALGDADLAAVESGDRLVDLAHRTSSRIAAARSHSFGVGTSAIRTYPSPESPRYEPGATTTPWRSSRSAQASDVSPFGTSTQRYMVAALAATRQPRRSSTGRRTSR